MGHAETVTELLESGADADLMDASGASPLMAAVGGGHKAIAKILLDEGKATVDLSGSHGMTALSYAADRGHSECIRVLLAAGARPNKQAGMSPSNRQEANVLPMDAEGDGQGFGSGTALMAAAYNGNVNSVQALLEGGANAGMRNDDGKSAQDLARKMSRAGSGHLKVIQMLAKAEQEMDKDL